MIIAYDIPSTAIVYMVDANGYALGVRSKENLSIGSQAIAIIGQPLEPIECGILEDELLSDQCRGCVYADKPAPLPTRTAKGIRTGVPIRFLGPGTGGMAGIRWPGDAPAGELGYL